MSVVPRSAVSSGDLEDGLHDEFISRVSGMIPALPQEATGPSISDSVAQLLLANGIGEAFGILGGAVAPLCEALAAASIRVTSFRHETGACFAAMESYFASGVPVAVFATTGPGLTNALTGLVAARWEGAKIVFLSGSTPHGKRGNWAFQETSAVTLPYDALYAEGTIFDYFAELDGAYALATLSDKLTRGFRRPQGFLAHIAIPIDMQCRRCGRELITALPYVVPTVAQAEATRKQARVCAPMLEESSFVIWVGFGARHAHEQIRALAERTGAPVMCSPRAKGTFPERHPAYLGVTGFGGHGSAQEYFREHRPDYVLVLGSRLGEFTSFWDPNLLPTRAMIHVDIEKAHIGTAYSDATTLKIRAEIGEFLDALLEELPTRSSSIDAAVQLGKPPVPIGNARAGCVRPEVLMHAIQEVVVDKSEAIVLTEAGNAFAWTTHFLRFSSPGRYRVSVGFGSMGHAVAGVVGAAHGSGKKAVAVVGDGAMLMLNEINTAVALQAEAVWIVLNDARYGMIESGMRAQGMVPVAVQFPRVDFGAVAKAMGAEGIRVTEESELDAALRTAMATKGPILVDVIIDPTRTAPFLRRIESLMSQGAQGNRADG